MTEDELLESIFGKLEPREVEEPIRCGTFRPDLTKKIIDRADKRIQKDGILEGFENTVSRWNLSQKEIEMLKNA